MTAVFTLGPALLFCPADRPERFEKALERSDAVILDLEDAVAPERKAAAREALIDTQLDPARTIVRVNPAGGPDLALDLAALASTSYRTVMVAKAGGRAQLSELAGFDVIVLCETAAGVLAAAEMAASPNVVALMWGAEDLVASLGGSSSRFADGQYRDVARHARSTVLLAAGANGKAAIDSVYLDIDDLDALSDEATDAAALGFTATACIHPSQVSVIREAYQPTAEDVALARELLNEAATHNGVFTFRGRMVDGPILRHAETVIARARAE